MKKNILRIILILLLFGTFYLIFNFSSQNSEESGGKSRQITEVVTKNVKDIQDLSKSEKIKVLYRIESIIRKIAHFSIYSFVGILVMAFLSTYNISENKRIIFSLLIGVLYASTDEFHQRFVPGRSGELTDIFLDSLGVLFGCLIILLILKIIDKNQN